MNSDSTPTIGIIGAGHIGTELARRAIATGHEVVIANSRGPETLDELIRDLGPRARAATTADAAEAGDFVIVTIPLKNIAQVPPAPLSGKIVIDTNNYYPQRDGQIAELDSESATVSGLLQAHLPESRVVKGFNHINFADIEPDARPEGSADRRALAVFGDDADAKRLAIALHNEFGYDAIDGGSLDESWKIERDQPGYGAKQNEAELRANIALAVRDKNSTAATTTDA